MNILFLPFILFESFISNIARNLNLEPPPQFFSQLGQGQNQLYLPPAPTEFIKSVGLSNIEEETVERDERGFITRRTIHRQVSED